MKPWLKSPFEHMLQGLVYWLTYKRETYKCQVIEADVVMEAVQILQAYLPHCFKLVREYPYRNISQGLGRKYADLAILNNNGDCECLMEFKLADSTNGSYTKDITKMSGVKAFQGNIDCYSIIVFRKSTPLNEPKNLVLHDGKARRVVFYEGSQKYKVKRVCNAVSSHTATTMKKVICLELL